MAFVTENGTGLANANAYVSVAFCDSYFADRGVQVWDDTDSLVKQQAIVRATDYLDLRYRDQFKGLQASTAQALCWPRVADVYKNALPDVAAVPVPLQRACAEYALRALTTALAPDPVTDATGRPVASTSEKVGPIEEKVEYVHVMNAAQFVPYPAADNLLKPILRVAGSSVIRG